MTAHEIAIRKAMPADAETMSALLIASITQLCRADHGDNPEKIAAWTANKSPEHITGWIDQGETVLLVAELSDIGMSGVGAAFPDGRIVLNYVHPDARFRGVSRAMLRALEHHLAELSVVEASLTATRTASDFYLAQGWQICGPEEDDFGFPGQPMIKQLT